ncbi:carbonic anhydrase family protein [Salmonella bongori]|uniref:carbonic anhydrase n=3 Tax=Salmonella TaxID=590 RepID=A0A750KKM7_SALER|nr:carbonic anhydrase family protein [Salmonella bongori]ECG8259533.1 carbonic anhydrase family protein [Salmonella bongori serovar 48:i:-]EGS1129962.1 carbonic anhydrase family protein [Salmonella bongori CFSAN000509]HAC6693244.1 carbonic anhydrase family protein [Salmonella bongori serovar 44:r:-]AGR60647.1 Carbonic anhydrase [Salmonella bongori N268-08]AID27543.1 carbonic anhydrase [Salmonella bongori serovar 48:z41:-- str. RKS3044]
MKSRLCTSTLLAFFLLPISVFAGDQEEEHQLCQTDINQPPGDIRSVSEAHVSQLEVQYIDSPSELVNNGQTLLASMRSFTANTLRLDDQLYTLEEFHFHAPAENTIDGKRYDMELHLMHRNSKGELAVVVVMFTEGAPNKALEGLWQSIPSVLEKRATLFAPVDINLLLPVDKTYWRLNGSPSSPSCLENAVWVVLQHPLTLSPAQLEKFTLTVHNHESTAAALSTSTTR